MVLYRERVYPNPFAYIALLLVIPAFWAVFAQINMILGLIIGISLYIVIFIVSFKMSPVIIVTQNTLNISKASIEKKYLDMPELFKKGPKALEQLRSKLDIRAYVIIRGGLDLVKIPVNDENDPTPYWLIATRNPDKFIQALQENKI